MIDIVSSAHSVCQEVALALLWLIGLPGDDDEEELAGFVTANWDRIKSRLNQP